MRVEVELRRDDESDPDWVYYYDEDRVDELDPKRVGKWTVACWPDSWQFVVRATCGAVKEGVVVKAKHTSRDVLEEEGKGVCCFYLNGDDKEAHRRILRYMVDKKLVLRTRAGRFYNISFKYDEQPASGEHGQSSSPAFKLSDFMDLETGEFLD